MTIYSFFEQSYGLKKTRIEISLIPGLPEFKVTGLPDASMKESLLRVKSALVMQGFQLPKTHQVLVNLNPAFEKKKSKGLELAIACAYLWQTDQVPKFKDSIHIYGELGLGGEVKFLPELSWLDEREDYELLSGATTEPQSHNYWALQNLRDLMNPEFQTADASMQDFKIERPNTSLRLWNTQVAKKMAIIAIGQHHTLLAGPAGSGKSSFSQSLYNILPVVEDSDLFELRRWSRFFSRQDLNQRPLVQPHHTATPQAVLGGGRPVTPGDISRAHKGILLLDEFLEFPNAVREALREPMETGEVHISRQAQSEKLPADFLLIATTNLCPCGSFVPKDLSVRCRFSLRKCRSYLERLSGPLTDRFDILEFSNSWKLTPKEAELSESEIIKSVQMAKDFQKKRKAIRPNGRMTESELVEHLERPQLLQYLPTSGHSRRRNQSLLRVARSLADYDSQEKICLKNIRDAIELAWRPFESLNEPNL